MLRLKEFNIRAMHTLTDDIERRIRRTESSHNSVSGYKMSYNEDTGKLTLTKGDTVVYFSKDT